MIKNYILRRLAQPSTWAGILTTGLALVAQYLGAEGLAILSAALSGAGLVHVNESK